MAPAELINQDPKVSHSFIRREMQSLESIGVRPGVDGWLVPAGDVAALADAIEACVRAPAAALARMAEAARGRVMARHSGPVAAERLAALFRDATATRAAVGQDALR